MTSVHKRIALERALERESRGSEGALEQVALESEGSSQEDFNRELYHTIQEFSRTYDVSTDVSAPIVSLVGIDQIEEFMGEYNPTVLAESEARLGPLRDVMVQGDVPHEEAWDQFNQYLEAFKRGQALDPDPHTTTNAFEEVLDRWSIPITGGRQHLGGEYLRPGSNGELTESGDDPFDNSHQAEHYASRMDRFSDGSGF